QARHARTGAARHADRGRAPDDQAGRQVRAHRRPGGGRHHRLRHAALPGRAAPARLRARGAGNRAAAARAPQIEHVRGHNPRPIPAPPPPDDAVPGRFRPRITLMTLGRGEGLLGMAPQGALGPRGGSVTLARIDWTYRTDGGAQWETAAPTSVLHTRAAPVE